MRFFKYRGNYLKKCYEKSLRRYPCDVFLHNALMFLKERKVEIAYDEICYAIIKSGGELTTEEQAYREIFREKEKQNEID